MTRVYVIYDARALEDVEQATVMSVAETLDEAIEEAPDYGQCVVLSYVRVGVLLEDERREWADPRLAAQGWPTS